MPTRTATTAEEARPEVSSQTISIRETIPDISKITRTAVYGAQTRSSGITQMCVLGWIEIMQI